MPPLPDDVTPPRALHAGSILRALGLAAGILWIGIPALAEDPSGPELDVTLHLKGAELAPSRLAPRLVLGPGGLQLVQGVASASYLGTVQTAPFPFYRALPSWNAEAPPSGGFRVGLRVRPTGGVWSPWLEVGNWGQALPARTDLATQSDGARVDIDTLIASPSVRDYQWRLDLFAGAGASPRIRRLSLCLTGDARTSEARAYAEAHPAPPPLAETPIVLPAPFRGQLTSNPALTGRICSPCTVASALGAYGIDVPTEQVAAALYDAEHDMYGVWPRAIMGACSFGVDGYVTRIRDFATLRRQLAAGRVVGASIRFKAGALKHPPYPSTLGHLILLRGVTASGDLITDDSYRAKDGDGKIWDRADLAIAWFRAGGVAYVFEGPHATGSLPAAPRGGPAASPLR